MTDLNDNDMSAGSKELQDIRVENVGGKSANAVTLSTDKVQKAFEQVAGQIRDMIFRGVLLRDDRLPSETALAAQFGVSRSTIREALRLLAAQNLIRTEKGASGGSFVTLPSVDNISEFLQSNISLLTAARDVTLEEFLESRRILEIPAARLAAERADADVIHKLHLAVPSRPLELNPEQQFTHNRDFHAVMVDATRNTLVIIATQPMFTALQTNIVRSSLTQEYHTEITRQHHVIAEAVEARDGDAAETAMRGHLEYVVPFYEKAWRQVSAER